MSTINWLADLGRRRRAKIPGLSPLMPRQPMMRPEIAQRARELGAERMKLRNDHPVIAGAELEAAVVDSLLQSQAAVYERRLEICYGVIATLGALAFVLACTIAWLLRPVLP